MENLVGQKLTLFMEGGWKLSGTVQDMNGEMVIVESEKNEYVVFKNKISYMLIGEESPEANPAVVKNKPKELSPEYIKYDLQGFSLPASMLNADYEEDENDFSVSFGSNHKNQNVSFSLNGDNSEQDR